MVDATLTVFEVSLLAFRNLVLAMVFLYFGHLCFSTVLSSVCSLQVCLYLWTLWVWLFVRGPCETAVTVFSDLQVFVFVLIFQSIESLLGCFW